MTLKDGLYAVSWGDHHPVEASFEIRNGKPYRVAPILKKRIGYWMRVARRII